MNDRLYRSRDERMFTGVAGGIAERYDFDPSLVRITWVILMLLTGGIFFLIYIVMAIVIPEAPAGADPWSAWGAPSPTPGTTPGWGGPDPAATTAAFAATGAAQGSSPSDSAPEAADGAPAPSPTADPSIDPSGSPSATPPPPPDATPGWGQPAGPPPQWAVPPRSRRHRDRSGSGAIIGGLILVLIGAWFLLRQYVPTLDTGTFWPVLLVIIGVALVIGSVRRGSGGDALH